MTLRVNKLNR